MQVTIGLRNRLRVPIRSRLCWKTSLTVYNRDCLVPVLNFLFSGLWLTGIIDSDMLFAVTIDEGSIRVFAVCRMSADYLIGRNCVYHCAPPSRELDDIYMTFALP